MGKIFKIAVLVGAGLAFGTVAGKLFKPERLRSGKISRISGREVQQTGKTKIREADSAPEEFENYFI